MRSRTLLVASFAIAAVVAACSSTGASPSSVATQPPASQPPASVAPASPAASAAPSASTGSAGGATIEAKPVGTIGTVLVAGSNGMTVYIFTKDVKDSGKSACTGRCLETWPALTVPAGATPTGRDRHCRHARDDHARGQRRPCRSPTTACRCTSSRTTRRPATRPASTRTGRPSSPDRASAGIAGRPATRPDGEDHPALAVAASCGRGAGGATLTPSFHGRSCEAGVPVP